MLPEDRGKQCLVLDLDETLIHYFYTPSGGSFLIRPFCIQFLEEMSKIFEIIIFTAAMKDVRLFCYKLKYADKIINLIDPNNKLIQHRLYRQHTSVTNVGFVKDLSKIGRDLNRLIMIDNIPENFRLQSNNGLWIKTWTEDMKDTQLKELSRILSTLISFKPSDVRLYIKRIKDDLGIHINKNVYNPFSKIDLKQI